MDFLGVDPQVHPETTLPKVVTRRCEICELYDYVPKMCALSYQNAIGNMIRFVICHQCKAKSMAALGIVEMHSLKD